jgi:hypothetical protein
VAGAEAGQGEVPLLLAAFGATPTGPLYHARRYHPGGGGQYEQVTVLVLREPPLLSVDDQVRERDRARQKH